MTPRVDARPSTRSSPKTAYSTNPAGPSTEAATRLIASRVRSGLLILTFDISPLPRQRNWAMPGGSNGYRVALARRPLMPERISSLPGTAGLPPSISSSTSCPELDSIPWRSSTRSVELMGIQPDSVSVIKGQAVTRPLPSTVFGGVAHDRATEPHHRPRSRPRGLGEVHGRGLRPTRAPTVRPLPGRANRKRRQPGLLPGSRPDQPTALRVPGLGSGIRRDLRPGEGAWPTLLGRSEEDPPRRDQSQRWRARGLLPRSLRARPRDHNPALRVGRVERVEPNN